MISFTAGQVRTFWAARAKLRKVGAELRGPCPIHKGKRDSFAVNIETGRACCHSKCGGQGWDIVGFEQLYSGCDFQAALGNIDAILGTSLSSGNVNGNPTNQQSKGDGHTLKKLAASVRAQHAKSGFQVVREFYYSDYLRSVRLEHSEKIQADKQRPEKTYRWEHRGTDGNWYSGSGSQPKPVYVNSTFRDRDQPGRAVGFEGEAKADLAGELGFAAFNFKDISEAAAAALIDWEVVLWPDADLAGAKACNKAAELIVKAGARSVAIANPPPDLPNGGDIVDAVRDNGWKAEDIKRLIDDAQPFSPEKRQGERKSGPNPLVKTPRILSADEILQMKIPEASMLIEGIVAASGASLLVGAAKSGKTLAAVQMAISVASGAALYETYRVLTPGPVLFVEKDDPSGIGSVKTILQRSSVSVAGIPFHMPERIDYQFGLPFLEWLEGQIVRLSARLVVLDSYTALRGPRATGVDIVKAEQNDLRQLDALAKRVNCAILVIHHSSKGSAGLDWSEKAAGTFAMAAATESQIFISRFPELEGAAAERLVRIRGRHSQDLEMVLRFRKETLDYEHVLEGGAATLYPLLLQFRGAFGSNIFSPKELARATGLSIATSHRHIDRLYRAGAIQKRGFGEYVLVVPER